MSRTRRWGLITCGETFEALVVALLLFSDAKLVPFGRRGKDGGQDAKSGDGKTVYQAKHHVDESAATAIRDAKAEAERIRRYRAPDHARSEQWSGVEEWVLVTNATFNPTYHERWVKEVDPAFSSLGLKASYQERSHLEQLLNAHRDVHRAFFEGETRVFLSVAEAHRALSESEPFLRTALRTEYVGREGVDQNVDAFLASDKAFLLVHAEGGTGKTRFLLETGYRLAERGDWQVLWANVESLSHSSTWFTAIVPERPTVLLVDDPPDASVLRVLKEQLRTSAWKIVVAARSTTDPVLQFLNHPRQRPNSQDLLLPHLTVEETETVARQLLNRAAINGATDEWNEAVAKKLAHSFQGYPIWLTLAVKLLAEGKSISSLPHEAAALCEQYLGDLISSDPATARNALRWIALLQPLNRESRTTIEALVRAASFDDESHLDAVVTNLVQKGLLRQRGINGRLIDIKPDVLRDHILSQWLCQRSTLGSTPYQPSSDAKKLVTQLATRLVEGDNNGTEQRSLVAIARIESLLSAGGKHVPLLDPFFEVLHRCLPQMGAVRRRELAVNLKDVAPAKPTETLRILGILREQPVDTEEVDGILEKFTVGHDDILLQLAWPAYHAAMGARSANERRLVLKELCKLAEVEATMSPKAPDDGKRALGLLERVLEGGPYFWSEFGEEAGDIALEHLSQLEDGIPAEGRVSVLETLTQSLVSRERHQTHYDSGTIHMNHQLLLDTHPHVIAGRRILSKIRKMLEAASPKMPVDSQTLLWKILSTAHTRANYVSGIQQNTASLDVENVRNELLSDLEWTLEHLSPLSPVRVLRAARKTWHWHYRHGTDPELREVANKLEALYQSREAVSDFEALTNWDNAEDLTKRQQEKARQLANGATEAIDRFLEHAEEFLGTNNLRRIHGVGSFLGGYAMSDSSLRAYITDYFQTDDTPEVRYQFALECVSGWLHEARKSADTAAAVVQSVLEHCPSEAAQLKLLTALYRGPLPRWRVDLFQIPELELIRAKFPTFQALDQCAEFAECTAWSIGHAWPNLKALLNQALDQSTGKQRERIARTVVESIQYLTHEADTFAPPDDLRDWVVGVVTRVDNLNTWANVEWELEKVMKILGRKPMSWLPGECARLKGTTSSNPTHQYLPFGTAECLLALTEGIDDNGVPTSGDCKALKELLFVVRGLNGGEETELLAGLDPKGVLLPRIVAGELEKGIDPSEVSDLARLALNYQLGGEPWRVIAAAALTIAASFGDEKRREVFSALGKPRTRFYSGEYGKVPRVFIQEADQARAYRNSETNATFHDFWNWYVNHTESVLRYQEQQLQEEIDR